VVYATELDDGDGLALEVAYGINPVITEELPATDVDAGQCDDR
jgi:hypothetical protein